MNEEMQSEEKGFVLADNEPVNVNTDAEQAQIPDRKEVEPPPDGGYGWVCVLGVFLVNAHTWGINSVRFLMFTQQIIYSHPLR